MILKASTALITTFSFNERKWSLASSTSNSKTTTEEVEGREDEQRECHPVASREQRLVWRGQGGQEGFIQQLPLYFKENAHMKMSRL